MQNMKSKESVESVIRTYYKHNEDYKWSEEDIKIEVFDPSETLFCRRRRIND